VGERLQLKEMKTALNILRTLQLRVSLFNIGFSKIIFLLKNACLVGGILGGFSGLRLVRSNPALAFVYFLTSVDSTVCYIALFSLAYRVTEVGGALAGEMEGVASRVGFFPLSVRQALQRILRKIPQFAMSVGGFHTVERETIPIFLDFLIQQIVGLLVSF
jgi:hypothetical protein